MCIWWCVHTRVIVQRWAYSSKCTSMFTMVYKASVHCKARVRDSLTIRCGRPLLLPRPTSSSSLTNPRPATSPITPALKHDIHTVKILLQNFSTSVNVSQHFSTFEPLLLLHQSRRARPRVTPAGQVVQWRGFTLPRSVVKLGARDWQMFDSELRSM